MHTQPVNESSPARQCEDVAQAKEAARELSSIVDAIIAHGSRRHDAVNAEGNLTRQMKAIHRRLTGASETSAADLEELAQTEALAPLMLAREAPKAWRKREEKAMEALARQLPAHDAYTATPGLGTLGLALIVAEAGDLGKYSNPAKLWRRFGLAPSNGKAMSTWRMSGGLTAKDWEEAGYCPRRRSLMFQIVDSLLKQQNPYRELCDARKAYEIAKAEAAGLQVLPATKIKKADKAMSLMHVRRRAERYVAKRLLLDLWKMWRDIPQESMEDAQ